MKKYLYPAEILLPKKNFEKWAVIACDQYTSDKKYWNEVEQIVGDQQSTLHMVLPEIYLGEQGKRIKEINSTMEEYLSTDVFERISDSMIYIEREITGSAVRKGVLALIDLEEYEYEAGKRSLIRATEQTVAERIPPRVKIRKDAPLEFPHVLLFIDDPEDSVICAASGCKRAQSKLYDFELMQGGGHIEGYNISSDIQDEINDRLEKLIKDGLLFAVGDGNHSLATAKECYKLSSSNKARYALVEVVNIHNPAIEFEPIYRVVFGVQKDEVLAFINTKNDAVSGERSHKFTVVDRFGEDEFVLAPTSKLPVGTLQGYLDEFIKEHPEAEVDYIHGVEAVKELCKKENTVGFIFDGMEKNQLFDAVIEDGSLPRKTFSMGHANDKRFYIEGREIK